MLFNKRSDQKGTGAAPSATAKNENARQTAEANKIKPSASEPSVTPKRTLELTRDDFRRIGEKQRTRRAAAIGACVSLLTRAPRYQDMRLKDLEWFLMPAIAAGQYLIGETKPSTERRGGVAAMLLWARVSPEVEKRLSESQSQRPHLLPEEWTSGDIVRVVEVIGRKDAIQPLLAEFKRTIAGNRDVKFLALPLAQSPKV